MPRILIADDREEERRLYGAMLRKAGFEVVESANGLQAEALIRGSRFDAALVDIEMPIRSGIEAIRGIRLAGRLPIPILVMSAAEDREFEARQAGADDFLSKPIRPSQLVERLGSLITAA